MNSSAQSKSQSNSYWIVIVCGCLIVAITFGPRSAMGFFQLPILEDTGWNRTTFGLAMALQNLMWGVSQPIMGAVADKYGTLRVITFGVICYVVGLWMMGHASAPVELHIGGGILVGIGVGSASFGIILASFARHAPAEKRIFVFGLGTAAGSFGMFIFAPISQSLISNFGWSDTLIFFSAAMLIVPILAIPLMGNSSSTAIAQQEYSQTAGQALREALGTRSYLLLVAGFFVCGFHVAFISAHFPAYISDLGIDQKWAVISISVIGGVNIIGAIGAGIIGQHYSMPKFLSLIYLARAAVFTMFMLMPPSPTSIMIFSVCMGFLWLSTVPPTNGLVAIMFGTRHLGMLGGIVFFTHQLGSSLGIWLGGYLFDTTGSFDPVWWIGVALGIFAALIHWPIEDKPVMRPVSAFSS
jgi:MFS family permease